MSKTNLERYYVTRDDIAKALIKLGIKNDDVVMLHSSLSSIGHVQGGANAAVDAFLERLLPEGTLVHAAFWGLYKQYMPPTQRPSTWNVERSPSTVGVISETLRQRPGCLRSDDAQCSVVAIGKKARPIVAGHPPDAPRHSPWGDQCFGVGCPWDKFYEWDVRYILLGCDHDTNTMLEYIQTIYHNDYLLKEDQKAPWPLFNLMLMGRKLERERLVTFGRIGEATVRIMSPRQVQDACINWLENDPTEFFPDSPYIQFTKWHKQERKRFRDHFLQLALKDKS